MWSHRVKEMKTEKHCQRHGPASDPYCVDCYKDQLAKEKANDRLALTTCSPSSNTPETQTKVKRICGNWNNAGDRVQEFVLADVARKLERERNEARAMARDMRNQLEKTSPARLIFPWENAERIRVANNTPKS